LLDSLLQEMSSDHGEVICLDDSSEGEPEHRDMGVGTNDRQEDVAVVDSKDGVLDSLKNVAVTQQQKEVGPTDRAFWGKGEEDSDEVQIVDTKEVKQTILEVREKDMGVGTRDSEKDICVSNKRVKEGVDTERDVEESSRERDVGVGPNHPTEQKSGRPHKNPSAQAPVNIDTKVKRKSHSAEKRDGKVLQKDENVTELESLKTQLARSKPKKKNDNINISISKSAMKLSKNMNISISMVAEDKKERRVVSSLSNQSNSVICIDSSESDSEQRNSELPLRERERSNWEGAVGREKERNRPDGNSGREDWGRSEGLSGKERARHEGILLKKREERMFGLAREGERVCIRSEGGPVRERVRKEGGSVKERIRPEGGYVRERARPEGGVVRERMRPEGGAVRERIRKEGGVVRERIRPAGEAVRERIRPEVASVRDVARDSLRPDGGEVRERIRLEGSSVRESYRSEVGSVRDMERIRPDGSVRQRIRPEGDFVRDRNNPDNDIVREEERIRNRSEFGISHKRERFKPVGSEQDRSRTEVGLIRERERPEIITVNEKEWNREDSGTVRERDWERNGSVRRRSPDSGESHVPTKHFKILEKYSPSKAEKFKRRPKSRSGSTQRSLHTRYASDSSNSPSRKKKKRKKHRRSSPSSSSSSSSSSDSENGSSVVITKKRKGGHYSHSKRRQESTSEMVVKKLKRSSDHTKETTSERYIKQLKSNNLLKLAPKPVKLHKKTHDYAKKSTSELFLENLQKRRSSCEHDISPPPRHNDSDSESDYHSDSKRSATSEQLFDRLLMEPERKSSFLSPAKLTDTGSCQTSSDERSNSRPLSQVKVKDGVDAFLRSCQRILPSSEFPPVFKKVSKYMSNLSPLYLNSSSLKNYLDLKWALLDTDQKNVFIHVKDVLDELKKYKSDVMDGNGKSGNLSEVSDVHNSPKKKISCTTLSTKVKKHRSPSPVLKLNQTIEMENSKKDLEAVDKIINKSPVHLWKALKGKRNSSDSETGRVSRDSRGSVERNDEYKHKNEEAVSADDNKPPDPIVESENEEAPTNIAFDDNSNHSTGSNSRGNALFAFLDLKPKVSTQQPKIELEIKEEKPNVKPLPVKKRVALSTISNSVPQVRDIGSPIPPSRKSSAETQCFNKNLLKKDSPVVSEDEEKSMDEGDDVIKDLKESGDESKKTKNKKKASLKHVKKLEKAMRVCAKQIKKHEEADVDWEKDDDSNFIMAAKLKKRYMAIYNKIAEYKELSKSLDRKSDKRFSFTESKYPAINQKIEKFVNRTKSFPDFFDIKKEVDEVNVKRQLMLSEMQIHTEAERIFVIVGKKLKRRRNDDEAAVMYSYLKDDDKGDPAAKDRALEKKLDELGKVAATKIEKVFERFVEKQVSKGKSGDEQGEDVNQDDDEEEEDDEEDDEVEEPSSQISLQSEGEHSSQLSPRKGPKPSTSYDSEPGEPEPSDAESLGPDDTDDEHAEHEKEMVDVLNYVEEGSKKPMNIMQKPVNEDQCENSRPGSARSRCSVGSVDDLLEESDGE